MSRKPKAVPLSGGQTEKDRPTAKPKTPAGRPPKATGSAPEKPEPRANARESTETRAEAARKPRAMKAPLPKKQAEPARPDETLADQIPYHVLRKPGRNRWGMLLAGSVLSLALLGTGLWFTSIVEDLFARHVWLGWGASALLAIAVLSLVIIVIKELLALWRLRKLAQLREEVMRTLADGGSSGTKTLDKLAGLYVERKDMHWHLSRLAAHRDDVMDSRDRLLLAEQYLMQPLDREAKQIITTAAKRISVVTAVNPAPSLDVVFTGYQILSMLRRLTELYGNRPGSVGTLRLAGMVGSHLAVTGGLALSDTFIQQFLGKGLAGRLSAKLGEGTVNGIMTARIGIAALDVCRPMPFEALERPGLREFIATIAGSFSERDEDDNPKSGKH